MIIVRADAVMIICRWLLMPLPPLRYATFIIIADERCARHEQRREQRVIVVR